MDNMVAPEQSREVYGLTDERVDIDPEINDLPDEKREQARALYTNIGLEIYDALDSVEGMYVSGLVEEIGEHRKMVGNRLLLLKKQGLVENELRVVEELPEEGNERRKAFYSLTGQAHDLVDTVENLLEE